MDRFWNKVDKGVGCWVWTATKDRCGYGFFWLNGRHRKAHRVAWTLEHGPIADGLCVLHRCDNPPCVNPAHLFTGTHADNTADKVRKGREKGAPGGLNPKAKLTREIVRQIRHLVATGQKTRPELARIFGVNPTTIGDIVNRNTWTHIEETP